MSDYILILKMMILNALILPRLRSDHAAVLTITLCDEMNQKDLIDISEYVRQQAGLMTKMEYRKRLREIAEGCVLGTDNEDLLNTFQRAVSPSTVIAMLDDLERKTKALENICDADTTDARIIAKAELENEE